MAATRLGDDLSAQLDHPLEPLDRARLAAYPGPGPRRQPVHTAYPPAGRYQLDVTAEWGAAGKALFEAHLPGPDERTELVDLDVGPGRSGHPRVAAGRVHPGQLVTRYAADFAFYRADFPAAADRLRQYRAGTTDAGLLDEPATAQAMDSVLFRGLSCGDLDEAEVAERAGVGVNAPLELNHRRVG